MNINKSIAGSLGSLRHQLALLGISGRKRILQRIYNSNGNTRPAFLVGCGRSGTSMIVFHLDRSWQIDLYNENNPDAFVNFRLREPDVVELLLERSSARVALFKPILSTQQSDLLLMRFPQAKIIFAFRHYFDVINSSILRFGPDSWLDRVNKWGVNDFSEFAAHQPPDYTKEMLLSLWRDGLSPADGIALYWLFYNQLYFDMQLETHDRVLLVNYESIVNHPASEFTKMSEFLEIDFEPVFIKGVFSSSIAKKTPAQVSEDILKACSSLWERLESRLN